MKLPIIKNISINQFSLFRTSINRTFLPGINMIVGGNGMGKTTLINLIIYGLVGNSKYEKLNIRTGKNEIVVPVPKDYFKGRIETRDQNQAELILTIGIGDYSITVTRALYRPRIIKIEILNDIDNRQQVYEGDAEDLETKYQNLIKDTLDIDKFEHFVFLISNLLVFGEDRNTIVWESETQSQILRLLFLEREFDDRFAKLSVDVTSLDTDARHKSETRKDIRKAIDRWMEGKESGKDNPSGENEPSRENIEIEIEHLKSKLESAQDEINELEASVQSEMSSLKTLISDSDKLELETTLLSEQLATQEAKFYSGIYQTVPPEYIFILETLCKQGKCQICGSSGEQLRKFGQELKENGQCIVCHSPINYATQQVTEVDQNELTKLINDLRQKSDFFESEQKANVKAQFENNREIKRIQDLITEKRRFQQDATNKMAELKAIITRKSNKVGMADEDPWLKEQNRQIADLDEQINQLYRDRDIASKSLDELNERVLSLLNEVNLVLTPLFSDFASKFLGTYCRLSVSQKDINRKPVAYMYPTFYEKERNDKTQVSESQRFFLDQAFRMALITWFTKKTGQPTFYIIETPEGSLDLAYELNVANMYTEFSKYGHTIIITSNLNTSNFLFGLYNSLGSKAEKDTRTLNLLHYGRLSSIQNDRLEFFNSRLNQLELPLVFPDTVEKPSSEVQ